MRKLFLLLALPICAMADGYITCALAGQLGNQMFQIAAVTSYALDHNCQFSVPHLTYAWKSSEYRSNVLSRVNVETYHHFSENMSYDESMYTRYDIYSPLPYESGIKLCIYGFFQSEKYFAHHRDEIVRLFAPTREISNYIDQKYSQILAHPTVAIHVRTFIPDGRNPDQVGIGGVTWDYYIKAIELFPKECHFLVFSDSMNWTKENFPKVKRDITFIEGEPFYIDFYLMSSCHHQIISPESTFSWWAAWLNNNPSKIVVAYRNTSDFLPTDWVQIDAEIVNP